MAIRRYKAEKLEKLNLKKLRRVYKRWEKAEFRYYDNHKEHSKYYRRNLQTFLNAFVIADNKIHKPKPLHEALLDRDYPDDAETEENTEDNIMERLTKHIVNGDDFALFSFDSDPDFAERRNKITNVSHGIYKSGAGHFQYTAIYESGAAEEYFFIPGITYNKATKLALSLGFSSFLLGKDEKCFRVNAANGKMETAYVYENSKDYCLSVLSDGKKDELKQIFLAEPPRPSYFQTERSKTKIYDTEEGSSDQKGENT